MGDIVPGSCEEVLKIQVDTKSDTKEKLFQGDNVEGTDRMPGLLDILSGNMNLSDVDFSCIYCGCPTFEQVEGTIIRCADCGRAWDITTGERKPGFDRDEFSEDEEI